MKSNPITTRAWFEQMIATTGFLESYPEFVSTLAKLEVVDDPDCGYMAVSRDDGSGRMRLHINVSLFKEDGSGFRGVLVHELHHVNLAHTTDPRYREVDHPRVMRLAMEISANEFIQESLPGHPILLDDFARYGIRPHQSTMERYELLEDAFKSKMLPVAILDADSCCRNCPAASRTDAWMNKVKADLLGQEPPSNLDLDLSHVDAATLVWQTEIRRFARSKRERQPSRRRPNRRQPNRIGEVPGRSRQPVRPRLLVAVDTSASMPEDIFPRINGEIAAIAKSADVVIVECDKAIRREYEFKGRMQSVQGRGGTSFEPVFDRSYLRKHRPDGVVYFTDGDGKWPEAYPGVATLWVLTAPAIFRCPWGRKVAMPGTKTKTTTTGTSGRLNVPDHLRGAVDSEQFLEASRQVP